MFIIFDLDGTLVSAADGGIANTIEEQIILPGVMAACEFYAGRGDTLAIASNQGGVAMGIVTLAQARDRVATVANLLGAEHWRFCPYHPEGAVPEFTADSECRKPKPGMLLELMAEGGFDPEDTIFVGDRPEDKQAAQAAGLRFISSADFFEAWI
jgi:D-glycero-D-manno-heptose 1,7-bisphosphate phosphatase